jgi:hypothetical protein
VVGEAVLIPYKVRFVDPDAVMSAYRRCLGASWGLVELVLKLGVGTNVSGVLMSA